MGQWQVAQFRSSRNTLLRPYSAFLVLQRSAKIGTVPVQGQVEDVPSAGLSGPRRVLLQPGPLQRLLRVRGNR